MFVDWNFQWHLKLNLNDCQSDDDKSVYFTHSFYYEGKVQVKILKNENLY